MDFETSSNQSDDLKSTISSLSGASISYQNEFAELRHLVDPHRYPTPNQDRCSTPTHNDSGCDLRCEDRISELSCQLQNSLKLNEQFKNDIFNLELKYHNKIEVLLRHNKRLKYDLANANEQIERLLRNFVNRTERLSVGDERNFVELEKKCHDLTLQNSYVESKLVDVTKEKDESELLSKQLRIELNEIKSEVDNKAMCVAELKGKISEQFVQLQMVCRDKNRAVQNLEQAQAEVAHLRRTREWYKEQLTRVQDDKKNLAEELLEYKLKLSSSKEQIEGLQVEVKACKNKFDLFKLDTLKEKEGLLQEIKNLLNKNECKLEERAVCKNEDDSLLNVYKNDIEDLQEKLMNINEVIKGQDETLKKLTKENSELTSRCVMLQKTTQQKEYLIEKLEDDKNKLLIELDVFKKENQGKSEEVLLLKNELDKIETELSSRKTEKNLIEHTIRTIRQQFSALKSQYDAQKKDLVEKNKQILHLQSEKQELFMNNNWKVCELEKAKGKDTQIGVLKNELAKKDGTIADGLDKIKMLHNEIREKEEINNELSCQKKCLIKDHQEEIKRYEDVLMQYKRTVENLENTKSVALEEMESKMSYLQREVEEKDKRLMIVNNEKFSQRTVLGKFKNLTHRIKALQNKVENSEELLKSLQQQIKARKHSKSDVEEKELKVLLQVKELQIEEKQKKYERNYRTLLKKVKEHMKGRNVAEKQTKYLQDLYNDLFDKFNSCNLKVNVLQNENDTNRKLLMRNVSMNEMLKEKLLIYEAEKEKRKSCEKCLEYDALSQRLKVMEEFTEKLQKEKIEIENLVLDKEQLNIELQNKIKDLKFEISNQEKSACSCQELAMEKSKLLEEAEVLKEQIESTSLVSNEVLDKLENEIKKNGDKSGEITLLYRQLEEANDKIDCLNAEIEIFKSSLRSKSEEAQFLESEKLHREQHWNEKLSDSEQLVEKLKTHVYQLQVEMDKNRKEKYFVQRLCNDLKFALKSHVNYNKVLKERLRHLCKEKEEFNSLPITLPQISIPEKYDEQYIKRLLQQNKLQPFQDKPLTDIQTSLDSLRKEIFVLQEQVSKKNSR